jgi:hypothetical protein
VYVTRNLIAILREAVAQTAGSALFMFDVEAGATVGASGLLATTLFVLALVVAAGYLLAEIAAGHGG